MKPGQRETKPWLDSRNLSHATVSTPKMTDDLDGRILQIHFEVYRCLTKSLDINMDKMSSETELSTAP